MNIEMKVLFLNKVQDAYNFGRYDPCNYNYLKILKILKEQFKHYGKTDYEKAIRHIILQWKVNQTVPKEAFIKLLKALRSEIR